MEAHYYNVNLIWGKGRKGQLSSPELNDKLEVATPPQFPKGVEGIWSPEHLFAASVNSCFMTTFLAIAENFKLEFESFNCTACAKLEQVDGKYLMTEINICPCLVILNESDIDKAGRVLQKAEQACLISNSIKSTVTMSPEIKISELWEVNLQQ